MIGEAAKWIWSPGEPLDLAERPLPHKPEQPRCQALGTGVSVALRCRLVSETFSQISTEAVVISICGCRQRRGALPASGPCIQDDAEA